MVRAGRVSIPLVIAIGFVVVVAALFFLQTSSPAAAGGAFMSALLKADADKLAEVSHIEGKTTDQLRDQWKQTLAASKHYRFTYKIRNTVQPSPDTATVQMEFVRNVGTGAEYAEPFELPLVKINGQWKVELRSLNRDMYPFLPR